MLHRRARSDRAAEGPRPTPGGVGAGVSITAGAGRTGTGPGCARPWPRSGRDTLAVTKLDRLARSVPGARIIVDELTAGGVRLSIGSSVHDPADPIGRLLFNVLSMVTEFEADLIRAWTREGMAIAKAKGRLRGRAPKLRQAGGAPGGPASGRRAHRRRARELFQVARSTVDRAIGRAGSVLAGVPTPPALLSAGRTSS